MREAQVLAATRAVPEAWLVRHAGPVTTLVPASFTAAPRDAIAELALVLAPADPMLEYRVATLLDLQLRPIEARIRTNASCNRSSSSASARSGGRMRGWPRQLRGRSRG